MLFDSSPCAQAPSLGAPALSLSQPTPERPRRRPPATIVPSVTGPWDVSVRDVPADWDGAWRCLKCEAPLDLHQPDPDRPDRLLGTCTPCGCWHLIAAEPASVCLIDPPAPAPPHDAN